jgi:hypothetical protein
MLFGFMRSATFGNSIVVKVFTYIYIYIYNSTIYVKANTCKLRKAVPNILVIIL